VPKRTGDLPRQVYLVMSHSSCPVTLIDQAAEGTHDSVFPTRRGSMEALQRDFHIDLSDGFLYDCRDWKVQHKSNGVAWPTVDRGAHIPRKARASALPA
jgi:hypothetical protein